MCLKHQKEGESRQDEGKKLPLDYTDSQDRQLKFDERQEIKRDENDDESSSSDVKAPQTNESLEDYKRMRHGLLHSL